MIPVAAPNPPHVHYLDHACLGRPTAATLDVVHRALRQLATFDAPGTQQTIELFGLAEHARMRVAELVCADPANITLIENTTSALGLVASSVPLRRGDNILIDDLEFVGAPVVWRSVARRTGVELRPAKTEDGRALPEHFAAVADDRSRVLVVSSVQEVSGFRADMPAFAKLAKSLGAWLVVDGIQEVGAVPVDLGSGGIDAYCAGGHKWLRSPFGAGFLYLSPRLLEQMQPPFQGYAALDEPADGWDGYLQSAARSPFDNLPELPDARRLRTGGFPNWVGAAALAQAASELLREGPPQIWARILQLRQRLIDGLRQLGFRVLAEPARGSLSEYECSGIVCFRSPAGARADAQLLERLTAARVYVSLRRVSGVGGIRAAVHFENTEADIDSLLEVAARFAHA